MKKSPKIIPAHRLFKRVALAGNQAGVPMTSLGLQDIVYDQENQMRYLLNSYGLERDKQCPGFHKNAADVSTASSVQVRQPLYSGSIGRWKTYGNRLDVLKSALGPLAE